MFKQLIWLTEVLEAAGLKVALLPGWENRGRRGLDMGQVLGVICHHTGGSRKGNMPTLKILVEGRNDLPRPLARPEHPARGPAVRLVRRFAFSAVREYTDILSLIRGLS